MKIVLSDKLIDSIKNVAKELNLDNDYTIVSIKHCPRTTGRKILGKVCPENQFVMQEVTYKDQNSETTVTIYENGSYYIKEIITTFSLHDSIMDKTLVDDAVSD